MAICLHKYDVLQRGAVVDMRHERFLARACYQSITIEKQSDSDWFWDFDLSAFLLDASSTVPTTEYFVFYNNRHSPDEAVEWYDDDNDPGGTGEMTLGIDLTRVETTIVQIVLVLTIHDAKRTNQTFRNVVRPWIRFCTNTGELFRYEPTGVEAARSLEMCRILRNGNKWVLHATGIGSQNTLEEWVGLYVRS